MKAKLIAAIVGVLVLGFTGLAQADFVGNKDSKTFHSDQCHMVKMMKDENKIVFKTSEEAEKAGYAFCKKCAMHGDKAMSKAAFVGNKNSMMFHKSDCPMAEKMKAENLANFATKEEAEKAGYKACAKCFPLEKKEEKMEAKAKKIEEKAETKAEEQVEKMEKKTKKANKLDKK